MKAHKKIAATMMAVAMMASMSTGVFADMYNYQNYVNGEVVSTFVGDDGITYEYVQYAKPVTYEYDGTRCTSLGKIRPKQASEIQPLTDYREWKEYEIIDYGIVDDWMYMSNPYFITSVAKGEIVEGSVEKKVSMSARSGINIPAGSQNALNKALRGEFSLTGSGSYTTTISIRLSGPEDGMNTRSFYYRTGYHKHNITIVEKYYSNWDGLMSEEEYDNCYGYEPAVQYYSEDSRV